MGILNDLFGGGGAEDWENKIREGIQAAQGQEQSAEGAYGPYMGNQSAIYNEYLNAIRQGANPIDLLNKYMSAYQESPAAKAQIAAGQQAGSRAAAASGMLGSGAAIKQAASQAEAIRGQDMQNYLNQLFGIRQQYLGGIGGLEGQGLSIADQIARMRYGLGGEELNAYNQMGQAANQAAQQRAGAIGGGIGLLGKFMNWW